ncbi:hypothetical protein [Nocardioides sp.]|uniref:hypothetical protein n=1 Tax=Nocardioides sp. TaxID=35761 RepID=UPI0035162F3E
MVAPLPLAGRTAVVTGVSRRRGIGFAVACRLADLGASLGIHHHRPHDVATYGDPDGLDGLLTRLRSTPATATTCPRTRSTASRWGDRGVPRTPRA